MGLLIRAPYTAHKVDTSAAMADNAKSMDAVLLLASTSFCLLIGQRVSFSKTFKIWKHKGKYKMMQLLSWQTIVKQLF